MLHVSGHPRRPGFRTPPVAASWAAAAIFFCASTYGQGAVPDGFELSTVVEGLSEPVALAWTPDGRLFVAQRNGVVRVVINGTIQEAALAEIDVFNFSECGLLGMTLDPSFEENHYVYLFTTISRDEQQILRVTEQDGIGDVPEVIRSGLPTQGGVHNGGCLRFGPDGMLYFAIGDTGTPDLSQDSHTFAGKLCRIHPDGSAPTDNPLTTPTGAPSAIYAQGFRNPFRFCFASDGRLFLGDVGSNGDARREEINLVSAGGNYGWPEVEGNGDSGVDPSFLDPLVSYQDEGSSIAGCTVYEADSFPSSFRGNLFHLDFVSHALLQAVLDGSRITSHRLFAQLEGGPVDLATGPDGALYYAEYFSGRIRKLAYVDGSSTTDDDRPTLGETVLPDPTNGGRGTLLSLCGAGIVPTLLLTLMTAGMRITRRRTHARGRRMILDR